MSGVKQPMDSKLLESTLSHHALTRAGFDFRFSPSKCEQCGGKCCVGEGYVFVSVDEMLAIAEFLGLEFESFTQKFVRKVGYKFSLVEKSLPHTNVSNDLACVFFDAGKCAIYPARPKQCREFPFWDAHRADSLDSQGKESLQQECLGVQF